MTIVCGDSHTATHGAFGALAFGIGTSEVEHVLATQTLKQARAKNMKIEVRGKVAPGITAKDIILAIIGKTTMLVVQAMWWNSVVKPFVTFLWKAV